MNRVNHLPPSFHEKIEEVKVTYVSLHLTGDQTAGLVNDGVDFLNDVKVRLIVGVFDACASPWHVGQLTGGQVRRDATMKPDTVYHWLTVRRLAQIIYTSFTYVITFAEFEKNYTLSADQPEELHIVG